MHANRTLLLLLLLTTLSVDAVLVGLLSNRSRWPDALVAIVLGLAGGQINLGTLWAVLGTGHLPWRIGTLFVVPTAWAVSVVICASEILPGYRHAAAFGVHFLTQMVLLASITLLVRLTGARLSSVDFGPVFRRPRRLQFTIRYLFGWLTATAIALSLLKTAFENTEFTQSGFEWDAVLILGLVNSMLGLTSAWLISDTRGVPTRLIAASLTLFPAAVVVGWVFCVATPDRFLAVTLLLLVVAIYSSVALLVLRVAGFRLIWLTARSPHEPGPPVECGQSG